jgi:hypothetical protein
MCVEHHATSLSEMAYTKSLRTHVGLNYVGPLSFQTKYSLPSRQSWRGDRVEDLNVLTAKLQTELGIEMKPESE